MPLDTAPNPLRDALYTAEDAYAAHAFSTYKGVRNAAIAADELALEGAGTVLADAVDALMAIRQRLNFVNDSCTASRLLALLSDCTDELFGSGNPVVRAQARCRLADLQSKETV